MKKCLFYYCLLCFMLCLYLLPMSAYAADEEVMLNVNNGNIVITDTGYSVNGAAEEPFTGNYILTGQSGSKKITINTSGRVDITLKDMVLSNPGSLNIQNGAVYITLNGENLIQATQDGSGSAVVLADRTELHFTAESTGSITMHGGSNYHGGSTAVVGGNVYVHGGNITMIGGNKIVGSYGKAFDVKTFSISGGTVNCYQGLIESADSGTFSAEEIIQTGGTFSGDRTAPPSPVISSELCKGIVILQEKKDCEYSIDGTQWQDSPLFENLTMNQNYTFYQRYKAGNGYAASPESHIQYTITFPHNWAAEWHNDETAHWHDCENADCPITDNQLKDGYETHTPEADDGDCTTAVHCTVCSRIVKEAPDHNFTNYISDGNASCTADGTKTAACGNEGCKETDTVIDTGSALGHTMKKTGQVDATCTKNGKQAYYTCKTCGKYFEDENGTTEIANLADYGILPAAGHQYTAGVCNICGKTDGRSPRTGDSSSLWLWFVLAVVSVGISGAMLIYKNKTA